MSASKEKKILQYLGHNVYASTFCTDNHNKGIMIFGKHVDSGSLVFKVNKCSGVPCYYYDQTSQRILIFLADLYQLP